MQAVDLHRPTRLNMHHSVSEHWASLINTMIWLKYRQSNIKTLTSNIIQERFEIGRTTKMRPIKQAADDLVIRFTKEPRTKIYQKDMRNLNKCLWVPVVATSS